MLGFSCCWQNLPCCMWNFSLQPTGFPLAVAHGYTGFGAHRLSSCGIRAFWLWCMGTGVRGSAAVECRLSCPMSGGILVPQLGIKLRSPALEGRYITTMPPGNSLFCFFCIKSFLLVPIDGAFLTISGLALPGWN